VSALETYRDDGPLAGWVVRTLAGRSARPATTHGLGWLVPTLVRVAEFGGLIALTMLADADALPVCFAFLAVLAFHHYDTVYRLRHQRLAPPSWVRSAGGGWDGRLAAACALALTDALGLGLLVAATGLGLVYVGESAHSWLRFTGSPAPPAGEGDVLE
jgi:hypothetical protein